ncbi:MAG TPA: hypothetical protein ENJ54_01595 [Chloroflexi bacterium]|nr:hypothetical protein [Chloroflexota bacterium]
MKYLSSLQNKNNFIFWLAFLGGNLVLFAPMYILTAQGSAFFPSLHSWAALQARENYDLWRLGLEWVLLFAVWVAFPRLWTVRGRRAFRWAAFALLLVFLIYQIYEAVDVALYHNTPNFYNDWAFLGGGIGFVLDSLTLPWWAYPAGVVGLIVAVWLIYQIATTPFTRVVPNRLHPLTRGGILVLAAAALAFTVAFPAEAATPEGEVASLSLKLAANIRQARLTQERVQAMQQVSPYKVYDYRRYTLAEHPNVYLFFLESYGSVLINDPVFHSRYEALMDAVQQELSAAGWHMASGLSRSPVWGGGSWMAYTSALCGVRIAQQPQYLTLKYSFQNTPYPNLGRYMQSQGYRFTWVVPIDRELSAYLWKTNRRFYGPDVWLTFSDLNYHGPEYSWGPSPPDQYTLGFLRAWLAKQPPKPNFVFFLTQNTHYPFAPVPPIVKDWRELNDPNIDHPDARPKPRAVEAYMEAVTYDWQVLADFIRTAGKNDVFILVGDHQPPAVSGPWDGYETIMHVIARDPAFVESFTTYGLVPGMLPDPHAAPLHHEGLYSLLVRQLVARWGTNPNDLPAYHPQGIRIPGILPKVRSIYHKAQKFKPHATEQP